jgi:hypothetical protein
MRREFFIEALVVDSVVRILDRNKLVWLNQILEHGFRGFANMSDEQLRDEFIERGLALSDIEPPDDDHHHLDEHDESLFQSCYEYNRVDARVCDVG